MLSNENIEGAVNAAMLNLEIDKGEDQNEFVGATLKLHCDNESKVESSDIEDDFTKRLSRNRPSCIIGRSSIRSVASKTSMIPGVVKSDNDSNLFFSYKVFTVVTLFCFSVPFSAVTPRLGLLPTFQ